MRYLCLLLCVWALLSGCASEIGDDCSYDADCSPNMDRQCDRGQPGGYCLVIGCGPDECPKESVCIEFTTPCPEAPEGVDGGVYEDCELITPNRGRTYCLKHCKKNSDCRKKYQCVEANSLYGTIIDFDSNRSRVCVPRIDE